MFRTPIRAGSLRKLCWVAIASYALVFQAGGCVTRDILVGVVADSLALAVTVAVETLLVAILPG